MLRETADKIGRDLGNLLDLVDVIRRMGEGVAESIESERAAAHGQRPLPGLAQDGEEIAGVVGLETRIAELTAENERLVKRVADLEIAKERQAQYSEDVDAACETAEERAQNLRTALHLITDAARLAGAKTIASRALAADTQAKTEADAKARQTSPSASPRQAGQAAD